MVEFLSVKLYHENLLLLRGNRYCIQFEPDNRPWFFPAASHEFRGKEFFQHPQAIITQNPVAASMSRGE
jgi:hypothetical protein